MSFAWRLRAHDNTRALPGSPRSDYVTSKKSTSTRIICWILCAPHASPPVGHNQRYVIHGDTAMHLFRNMIAVSSVVDGSYGLVIILRGWRLSR